MKSAVSVDAFCLSQSLHYESKKSCITMDELLSTNSAEEIF